MVGVRQLQAVLGQSESLRALHGGDEGGSSRRDSGGVAGRPGDGEVIERDRIAIDRVGELVAVASVGSGGGSTGEDGGDDRVRIGRHQLAAIPYRGHLPTRTVEKVSGRPLALPAAGGDDPHDYQQGEVGGRGTPSLSVGRSPY